MGISRFTSQAWGRFSAPFNPGSLVEGKIWGQDHWERVKVSKNGAVFNSFLDKSTGKLYRYIGCGPCASSNSTYSTYNLEPELGLKRVKAIGFLLFTPVYVAGLEVFHILRIIPKITYLALRIIYDKIALMVLENRELEEEGFWAIHKTKLELRGSGLGDVFQRRLLDILEEIGYCISSMLYAPLYGLAMAGSCLYLLYDPLNGGKCLSSFERKMWHDVDPGDCVLQIIPAPLLKFFSSSERSERSFSDNMETFFKEEAYNLKGWLGAPCMQPVGDLVNYDKVYSKESDVWSSSSQYLANS